MDHAVHRLSDDAQNRLDCDRILGQLPGWFGPKDVYRDTRDDLKCQTVFGVRVGGHVEGLMALAQTSDATIDIHLLAVAPHYHGKGIGRALFAHAADDARARAMRFLTVETLGPSHDNPYYPQTHAFYRAMGFAPIEEFIDFWGAGYPMLLLCKGLAMDDADAADGK